MSVSKKYLPLLFLLFAVLCSFSFNAYAGFNLDKEIQKALYDSWYYWIIFLLIGIPFAEYVAQGNITIVSGLLLTLSVGYIIYARFLY